MNKEKIKLEVKDWIENNRKILPLNIDSWETAIRDKSVGVKLTTITFGKYNSTAITSFTFYKPISRTLKL